MMQRNVAGHLSSRLHPAKRLNDVLDVVTGANLRTCSDQRCMELDPDLPFLIGSEPPLWTLVEDGCTGLGDGLRLLLVQALALEIPECGKCFWPKTCRLLSLLSLDGFPSQVRQGRQRILFDICRPRNAAAIFSALSPIDSRNGSVSRSLATMSCNSFTRFTTFTVSGVSISAS